MTRSRISTETRVTEKREEFKVEWLEGLNPQPKFTVRLGEKHVASVFYDEELPHDQKRWIVFLDGPGDFGRSYSNSCGPLSYSTHYTLITARRYLDRVANDIAVKSRKRVTTTTEE